jgi:hypothetical protein
MKTAHFALPLLIIFLFVFKSPALAGDVVINEFLVNPDASQWVELYNIGASTVDIGGWFIDDDGGTQKFTIPAGTTIAPLEFKVFESGNFNLDWASGDTIKLLNGSSIEDSYTYDTGTEANKSYGRSSDGAGSWAIFDSPTKEASNNTSSSAPTPTPTPIPSPTNTPTATPTSIPKPSTPEPKETIVASENNLSKILIGLGVIIITLIGVLAFRFYKRHE